MMKFNLMLIFPIILNFSMFMLYMLPSKMNKFHPMNLMILLIILTIFITKKMNMLIKSWMPFILFLTMIGGLMIIFLYITSLTNNEISSLNLKNLIFMLIKIFITMCFFKMILNYLLNLEMNYNNMSCWKFNIFKEKKTFQFLSNLYFNKTNSLLFSINYLFFTMICIMNICYKFKTPLRKISNYE